jgi:hypothetical protein
MNKRRTIIIVITVLLVVSFSMAMTSCGSKNGQDADTGVTSDVSGSKAADTTSVAAGSTTADSAGLSAQATADATTSAVGADTANGGASDASQAATVDQAGGNGAPQTESTSKPEDSPQRIAALAAVQKMTIELLGDNLEVKASVDSSGNLVLPLEEICEPAGWKYTRQKNGANVKYTLVFAGKASSEMTIEYKESDGVASNQVYKLGKQTLKMSDDLFLVDGKPYMPIEYFEIMQLTVTENKISNKITLEYK